MSNLMYSHTGDTYNLISIINDSIMRCIKQLKKPFGVLRLEYLPIKNKYGNVSNDKQDIQHDTYDKSCSPRLTRITFLYA